jgi:hypothetical protein
MGYHVRQPGSRAHIASDLYCLPGGPERSRRDIAAVASVQGSVM